MPLKTLFLNPPSFENFDGGASSRWPATREIESYWYPVWLAYPAGMLEGSRLLDAPPHHIDAAQTIEISKQYEFVVLFTSTPGFKGDCRLAEAMKAANPRLTVASVRVAVLDARLPGAVHVLPVAADAQRSRLAQALHGQGRGGTRPGQGVLAVGEGILFRRRHL